MKAQEQTQRKNFLKIVVLGDSDVGKTSILMRYTQGKTPANMKPTIGADFQKKEVVVNNTIVTVQIWDTAGQEKYQSIGYAFYRGADCCALCFDLTRNQTFEHLTKWKEGFLEHAAPNDPSNFPFIVMGNKCDKEDERQVTSDKAREWCRENGNIPYFETSALENLSVDDAFITVVKKALDNQASDEMQMPDTIGGMGGGNIQLNARTNSQASAYKRKKNCKC